MQYFSGFGGVFGSLDAEVDFHCMVFRTFVMSAMCMSRFALAATVLTWAEERPKREGTDRLITTSSCRRLHYSSQILEL